MLTDEEFQVFLKALGNRIKAVRKNKNLNMRDIMIATGHYDAQWRKYEAGGSMNLQSLMKIALALDVSLSELFDGLGQWPKRSVAEIEAKSKPSASSLEIKQTEVPASRSAPLTDLRKGSRKPTTISKGSSKTPTQEHKAAR